jgi:hypothetical protein
VHAGLCGVVLPAGVAAGVQLARVREELAAAISIASDSEARAQGAWGVTTLRYHVLLLNPAPLAACAYSVIAPGLLLTPPPCTLQCLQRLRRWWLNKLLQ